MAFLKQEFPELTTVEIPGYEVSYGKKGSALKLFYESVQFFNFIKKENALVDEIIKNHQIDRIVSDNRYGLWSKKIESIIITHQLFVKAPLGENIVHQRIEKLIRNFDECWIPDFEGEKNLAGDLAHLKPFNHPHQFIGALSRFAAQKIEKQNYDYDLIAILSGPEPQRTIFEKLVLEQIQRNKLKAVVLRGLPNNEQELNLENSNLQIFNHLSTDELLKYLRKSKVVVCRSGYSSIMDLTALGKKAILIPTPGQTEQEYLANYHLEKKHFYSQKQNEFDLKKALDEMKGFYP